MKNLIDYINESKKITTKSFKFNKDEREYTLYDKESNLFVLINFDDYGKGSWKLHIYEGDSTKGKERFLSLRPKKSKSIDRIDFDGTDEGLNNAMNKAIDYVNIEKEQPKLSIKDFKSNDGKLDNISPAKPGSIYYLYNQVSKLLSIVWYHKYDNRWILSMNMAHKNDFKHIESISDKEYYEKDDAMNDAILRIKTFDWMSDDDFNKLKKY